ncbi:MAG: ABC transporter permease [Bifidobacteriaceae bacterium]|jgi:ABC-2 type transport system permease protein|nr:ABC transporter permease [Bifidobacteriaceae bacterium]
MTAIAAPFTGQPYRSALGHNLSFGGIVKSEWIKLRSLRSTWWCAVLLFVLTIGFVFMLVSSLVSQAELSSTAEALNADGYAVGATGRALFMVGEVIAIVLGALTVTSEYSSGSIRSTLAVAPRRGPVLAAKALVVGAFTAVIGAVTLLAGTVAAVAVMSAAGYDATFGSDAVKMAVGTVFALVATAMVGLGLGFVIRSSAGAIASGLGLYLIIPMIMMIAAAKEWMATVLQLLPSQAAELTVTLASSVVSSDGQPLLGGYWGGMACQAAWAAAALICGYVVFKRRDA